MPTVDEVMTRDPVLVAAGSPVQEAAKLMRDRSIGALGIERDGTLVGVLTDRDIVVRAVADGRDPSDQPVDELASTDVVCVEAGTDLDDAEERMRSSAIRRLFVLEDGRPVGIVTADDLIAHREPESVVASQLDEGGLLRGDQGYTGQAE